MLTDEKAPPDAMHFRSLRLENVRAFGSPQSVEFVDENNAISPWNLIVGANGVGKTTLMQALAVMWPVPGYKSPDDKTPNLSTAELSEHEEDDDIMHFIRRHGPGTATMTAMLKTEAGVEVKVGVTIVGNMKLEDVKWHNDSNTFSGGPLVIGYGAARHVGHDNLAEVEKRKATEPLFLDVFDLYDAELIIEKLDHAAKSDKDRVHGSDARRLGMLKKAVASLLPGDLTANDIEIRGPHIAGRDPNQSGVHVRTPSGVTPLADLSVGYQTMFALTVDLAWRLFNAFPESAEPLSESAIVLIDEVDLHLHPQWQRDLRRHLLEQFPKVQFIATTHNPVTVQEALSGAAVPLPSCAGRMTRPYPQASDTDGLLAFRPVAGERPFWIRR